MFAVRNLRLCTKDCLCLYVCPTGATDTENGQVDWNKCIGCGLCAGACPSHAISMVPKKMPPQQLKKPEVAQALGRLAGEKCRQEQQARALAGQAEDSALRLLCDALAKSNRLMAEDLWREAGYMLPQSGCAHDFLRGRLADETDPAFPREAAEELLRLLPENDRP